MNCPAIGGGQRDDFPTAFVPSVTTLIIYSASFSSQTLVKSTGLGFRLKALKPLHSPQTFSPFLRFPHSRLSRTLKILRGAPRAACLYSLRLSGEYSFCFCLSLLTYVHDRAHFYFLFLASSPLSFNSSIPKFLNTSIFYSMFFS